MDCQMPSAAHTARNGQDTHATEANRGVTPLKRGRGRPPKLRVPIEAFSDVQFRAAMAEADQIEATRTMQQFVVEQAATGMHPAAFRVVRRLMKQGPGEAQAFYAALGRYLSAAGLLE